MDGRRDQTPAAAHMRERLLCLVVVSDFLEVWITVVSPVMRVRARPPEGRSRNRSAYEGEVQAGDHGRERIVNGSLGVNIGSPSGSALQCRRRVDHIS